MGKNCEQIRQLLVELEYGELDALDTNAVQAHLDECASCTARKAAYGAVRADLQSWNDVAPAPSRVTLVAMHRAPATARWSRSTKGLAVAASFLMGFLLTAAVANIRVTQADGTWSMSTSLWPAPQSVAEPVTEPAPVPVPAPGQVTKPVTVNPTQAVPVASLDREQLRPVIEQLMSERDAQVRSLVQQILTASEQRQRQEFDNALNGLYQTFDVQRTNDLLFMASEFGLMQENTGIELQRTNAAVDFLLTRVASDDRQPEQREQDD